MSVGDGGGVIGEGKDSGCESDNLTGSHGRPGIVDALNGYSDEKPIVNSTGMSIYTGKPTNYDFRNYGHGETAHVGRKLYLLQQLLPDLALSFSFPPPCGQVRRL